MKRIGEIIAHLGLAAVVVPLLVAVGQPLFTDDLWWHLALGEAFTRHGPWLAEDPLLFTAAGPPDSASWLADVALFGVWSLVGFTGLRVFHALSVAAILALAWSLLRRASCSRAFASTGTLVFAALGAYRLVQLRPELFTIFAVLALYRLLAERDVAATPRRVACAAGLFAVWANCHAAFPLGLALLGAGVLALLLASMRAATPARARLRARAARLGAALAACTAASLVNPRGAAAHLAWLRAGTATPDLGRVADEWARVDLLSLPPSALPPSPLAWALVWALLVLGAFLAIRALRRASGARAATPDPEGMVQIAWALVSLVALLSAVRFLWLGIFAWLALVARTDMRRRSAPAALASVLLAAAFFRLGDWSMISGVLPRSLADYARPYDAAKYHAHPLWFLLDAGIEGNAFIDYSFGGFLGFFGAPRILTFVNGSLNVTRDAIDANLPIRQRRGAQPGESFLALLERMRIEIFVGTRLPQVGPSRRPWFYTTTHLEGAPGWLCVFRNADSAVYLRRDPRGEASLQRVAAWYTAQRVPFDLERGFEPERVIRSNRRFATEHGLVPVDFHELSMAAHSGESDARRGAAARLAGLYASLGLYERAIRIDRATLSQHPTDVPARRRVVWSLLRLERDEEAREEAIALGRAPAEDYLSHAIAEIARDADSSGDAELHRTRIATLPVLTRAEAPWVLAGIVSPEPRPRSVAARKLLPPVSETSGPELGRVGAEP